MVTVSGLQIVARRAGIILCKLLLVASVLAMSGYGVLRYLRAPAISSNAALWTRLDAALPLPSVRVTLPKDGDVVLRWSRDSTKLGWLVKHDFQSGVWVYDSADGKVTSVLPEPRKLWQMMRWHPDGTRVLTMQYYRPEFMPERDTSGDPPHVMREYDIATGNVAREYDATTIGCCIKDAGYLNDGSIILLVTALTDPVPSALSNETAARFAVDGRIPEPPFDLRLLPNGEMGIVRDGDDMLRVDEEIGGFIHWADANTWRRETYEMEDELHRRLQFVPGIDRKNATTIEVVQTFFQIAETYPHDGGLIRYTADELTWYAPPNPVQLREYSVKDERTRALLDVKALFEHIGMGGRRLDVILPGQNRDWCLVTLPTKEALPETELWYVSLTEEHVLLRFMITPPVYESLSISNDAERIAYLTRENEVVVFDVGEVLAQPGTDPAADR